jgi:hypothetical protein
LFLNKLLQFGCLVGVQVFEDLQMFFGQIKLAHFCIRFADILMGFGQLRFQIDGLLIGFDGLIKSALLAVAVA